MESMFRRRISERLKEAESRGQLRNLRPRDGIDVSSNDYLGFAEDEALRIRFRERWDTMALPTGSSGSRLLRGHLPIFEELEERAAAFCGRSCALFFPSGYQANLAVLSAVLSPDDLVFSDRLNHASIVDGIRLSKARTVVYPHCDMVTLRKELEAHCNYPGQKFIVTESLFSMDGDVALLRDIAQLAEEFSAEVIVDESHATGLYDSPGGISYTLGLQGTTLATVHTGGKALGTGGAWIACDAELKHFLINFSRPFIYSTVASPVLALLLICAFEHWNEVGQARVQTLRQRERQFRDHIQAKYSVSAGGPIFPFLLGESARALHAAEKLRAQGFDARAIRPPTVAPGTARLRISLNSKLFEDDIARLIDALGSIAMEQL